MLGKAIPEAECWPTLAILKEILMSQSSPSCWFEVKLKFVFIIPSYELSVLGSESLTSPNIRHRRGQIPHLACPYGNWKFQLGLKTVILEHKLLFCCHGVPSVSSSWQVWWFLCSSWTSQPISSHLKVIVGVFFQTTYRIICTDIILLEWWRFRNMQLFRYGSERPSQHV